MFDPKCYVSTKEVYGGIRDDMISDLTLMEAISPKLTMDHRITQLHACVDYRPYVTSNKLNGLMLTLGVPKKTEE